MKSLKYYSFVCLLMGAVSLSDAFFPVVVVAPQKNDVCRRRRFTILRAELPDVDSMKATDMRKELESYGISTKSLFEKSEFAEAVKRARAEGKTSTGGSAGSKPPSSNPSAASAKNSQTDEKTRAERLEQAKEKAKSMKVADLKKELQARGVSTASFFEKSEFVSAYAEAIADGVSGSESTGGKSSVAEEPYDASYRDVAMQKIDKRQALMGEPVIDVQIKR